MNEKVQKNREPDQHIALPVEITRDEVLAEFKQERTRAKAETVIDEVLEKAVAVAAPKAMWRVSCTGKHDRDGIEIDGVRFTSRVLSKNLSQVNTVLPHITTCGTEVEGIDIPKTDFMRSYCLDVVKMIIMFHASSHFLDFLRQKYGLTETVHLHPGEFADWPITEQTQIFKLFDDPARDIGVKLTSTLTLQPVKSGTGIMFSNGNSFESCELCVQAHCPGRRKPYNPRLLKKFTEE